MALNQLKISRETHLPLGHLQIRIGETECGSRFWSIWPEGPIGDSPARMIINGFINDPEATAAELDAAAAAVRALAEVEA